MVLYYRYFHYTGPISWKNAVDDIELNNKVTAQESNNKREGTGLNHVRSFKSSSKNEKSDNSSRLVVICYLDISTNVQHMVYLYDTFFIFSVKTSQLNQLPDKTVKTLTKSFF